ncbi:hypothetical protein C0991_002879 [Blastosporella zonata]|nr:hypothetical protein C0991_002879 [Blastosporella zonata]
MPARHVKNPVKRPAKRRIDSANDTASNSPGSPSERKKVRWEQNTTTTETPAEEKRDLDGEEDDVLVKMASIGALLDHVVRERVVGDLDDEGIGGLDIRDIEILSLLGRSLLRTWFLRPSLSIDVINKRHDAVECFLHSENLVPVGSMHSHLKGIKNVPRMLTVLEVGRAKVSDWQGLVKIDWEESLDSARPCVRSHVDEELDNRKHSKVAEQISESVPRDYALSLNVIYFPQLDMDVHIGDLYSTIVDREIEIVQSLLEEILVHEAAISQACHICAELDCLLSFAEASQAFNYRRPVMVDENIIDIRHGRHPLQEQIIDTFVPNDASLVGGAGLGPTSQDSTDGSESDFTEWNSVLLCTGANACGKPNVINLERVLEADSVDSIYGTDRMVRFLLPYKVHSAYDSTALVTTGSFVPAESARLGIVDKNGAGLFCGVLQHLLARGKACPKVLAATHFHDVFRADLLDPDRSRIAFRHMEVLFTAKDGSLMPVDTDTDTGTGVRRVGVGEKITYLYRLAEGLSLDSHAAKCAEMFGVPSRLVQRAQYVSHLLSTHELGRLLDEAMTEEERLDLKDAEAVCRRFLAWDLDFPEQEADAKTMLARCLGRMQDDNENMNKDD